MSPPADDESKPVAAIFRSPVFNPSERFIQEQAAALTRYRPLVVGLERKGAALPRLAESMILPATALERLLFRLRGCGGSIEARVRSARPALIHAHFATDGLLVLPLARALGVPLVTSLRGYDVTRTDASFLRSGRPSLIGYALRQRRLMRGGDCFLAVSDALRDLAIARGFPAERTLTHYNGVDLDRFRPVDTPAEPGLVLHVGRLVEKTGTAPLLAAIARVPEATLVVIGDGPRRNALERWTLDQGLRDRVRFLGSLPPEEVAAWMRRATLLAAPSITAPDGDSEGLPNVVVEAAASGLPVVATRHSGIPEAVIDGETGFLVGEGDVDTLADRIGRVLASEDLQRDMGIAARRLAERKFDRVRLTERLEEIYDRVTHAGA
jgi:glycosyltransferase involved in cell wall biosynthesis